MKIRVAKKLMRLIEPHDFRFMRETGMKWLPHFYVACYRVHHWLVRHSNDRTDSNRFLRRQVSRFEHSIGRSLSAEELLEMCRNYVR